MARAANCSLAAALLISLAAVLLAACDVETTGSAQAKSPAEKMAERFAETSAAAAPPPASTAQAVAAEQKSDAANRIAEDAQQLAIRKRAAEVASKRADEKAKKAAASAAATSAEQLRADEAQMLADARAEAEARRIEMDAARIEREKAEIAAIATERSKAVAQAESLRLAEEQKATQLAALAAAAKASEAQKNADELRAAEDRRLAEETLIAAAKAAEQLRKQAADEAAVRAAELERRAEQTRQAEIRMLEAKREAEAKALTESLRRADAIREAKTPLALPDPSILAPLPSSTQPAATAQRNSETQRLAALGQPHRAASRATIMIIMEPGNKGIRRFEKTADPVLCVTHGCYVSEGAGKPALFKQRNQVLGFTNTLGARAGACQRSLGCAFRDVDLAGSGGFVQPVDMKVLAHDRRESQIVDTDSDCRIEGVRLICRRPLMMAGSYRLWVVPEALADRAGSELLERALREGLSAGQSAELAR